MSSKVHPIRIEVNQNLAENSEDLPIKSFNIDKPTKLLSVDEQDDFQLQRQNSSENMASSREAKFVEIIQGDEYKTSCKGIEMYGEIEQLFLELRNLRTNTSSFTVINYLSKINARIDDFFDRKLTFKRIHIKISKEALLLFFILFPISIAYAVQITVKILRKK